MPAEDTDQIYLFNVFSSFIRSTIIYLLETPDVIGEGRRMSGRDPKRIKSMCAVGEIGKTDDQE